MNIQDLFKSNGYSQYKVAQETGIPYTTLHDLCTGKTSVDKCSVETIYKLAIFFNVDIEDIINGDAFITGYYNKTKYSIFLYPDKTVFKYGDITIEANMIHPTAWSKKIYRIYAEMCIELYEENKLFEDAFNKYIKKELV